ncbi:heterokaryon incompatibility protein [Fusarium globosum]|uniref:Heterokaryon incompatibility protein n=1 Tax=Fusarium globosum TaxID=78864 RepID=A0A8H5YS57_9HYPO|nr:heterokaryon incompatibility protein [Fusarium globosum]
MAPTGPKFLFKYTEGASTPFKYLAASRKAGCFRVVEVKGLLSSPGEVNIYEYPTINFNHDGYEKDLQYLGGTSKYIAISHVWSHGAEVDAMLKKMTMTQKLNIQIDNAKPTPHVETISWLGLKQAAHAAYKLGATYFWLDFLCLDQVDQSDKEKELQICIMGDVYKHAKAVVIMIGGVGAAQSAQGPTSWCDRAWTLQEAILNSNTHVLVKWPSKYLKVPKGSSARRTWDFTPTFGPGSSKTEDICLVKIRDLLDIADSYPLKPLIPRVVVFDGKASKSSDVPRRALRACLSPIKPIKYAGVWRSMYMRTSSVPADMVYSIMTIFGIRIDPYRSTRPAQFVFDDLARKTAALTTIGPVWLTLGGVTGCVFPRDPQSGLLPEFSHKKNTAPTTVVEGKKVWVGDYLDDSPWYVRRYDMHFVSHSQPHIINAAIFRVKVLRDLRPKKIWKVDGSLFGKRSVAKVKLGRATGRCTYYGDLEPPGGRHVYAIYVGDIGDMSIGGRLYVLFMQYKKKAWEVVGDGMFKLDKGQKLVTSSRRQMITLGDDAQDRIKRWQVRQRVKTPRDMDHRSRRFHNCYGVAEVPDNDLTTYNEVEIDWVAIKRDNPRRRSNWVEHSFAYDLSKFSSKMRNSFYADTKTIYIYSYPRSDPPLEAVEVQGQKRLTRDGSGEIPFCFDGWSRSACSKFALSGVAALMIPDNKSVSYVGNVNYQTRVWFGDRVMYIQIRYHELAKPEFWQLIVVPYRQGIEEDKALQAKAVVSVS